MRFICSLSSMRPQRSYRGGCMALRFVPEDLLKAWGLELPTEIFSRS